jgi:hypothetical protein
MRVAPVWAILVVLAGCGKQPLTGDVDPTPDGGAPGTGGLAAETGPDPRVPKKHRAAGSACPSHRAAAEPPLCATGAGAGLPVDCLQDADCAAGTNGRCLRGFGPARCGGVCSYDACSGDADCPGAQPCECRASATDLSPNSCVSGSNCRVDADCGAGGFCSPSVVNAFCFCPSPKLCDASTHCYAGTTEVPCSCGDACGHGYFCHTAKDECVDDEDCAKGGTCNFDRVEGRWTCTTCWPVP